MHRKLFMSFSDIFYRLKSGELTWEELQNPSALFFFVAKDKKHYLNPDKDRWEDPDYPPNLLGTKARYSFYHLINILNRAKVENRFIYVDKNDIDVVRSRGVQLLFSAKILEERIIPHDLGWAIKRATDEEYPRALCALTVAKRLEYLLSMNGYNLTIPEKYSFGDPKERGYNIPELAELVQTSTEGWVQPIWLSARNNIFPIKGGR